MDKRGPLNQPHIHLSWGHQEGSTAHHLVNGGDLAGPASGDTKCLFIALIHLT